LQPFKRERMHSYMHTLSKMFSFVSIQSTRHLHKLLTYLQFYQFQASLNHRAIPCSCCFRNWAYF
jgi:hypothetical protein